LEDGEIKADELAIVTPDNMVVGIQIHSGRNRIVRRIFESLGYEVLKLDRTTFATLSKKTCKRYLEILDRTRSNQVEIFCVGSFEIISIERRYRFTSIPPLL
jgi:16S rRNA U516 pseudouridylate synthase RsuA-like enzyme